MKKELCEHPTYCNECVDKLLEERTREILQLIESLKDRPNSYTTFDLMQYEIENKYNIIK